MLTEIPANPHLDGGSMNPATRATRRLGALVWMGLVVATFTRVTWLASKPFWRDEAWAALLVGEPLDDVIRDARPIPVGFVALTKLAALLPVLPPEVAFRLPPLLGGLAALPCIVGLARALGATQGVAATALWLAVGMPALVYYSRELKSYGFDFLLAAALPWLTVRLFGREEGAHGGDGRTTVGILCALFVAGPWITFGAVFPITVVLAWGWVAWWRSADRATRMRWATASFLFGVSFAVAYVVALERQAASPRLHGFWRAWLFTGGGLPAPLRITEACGRYFTISLRYLFPGVWPCAIVLALIGSWAWPRRLRGFLLCLCVGTAAATVTAALANRYLLAHGRLLLFAAPPYILLVAAGLVEIGRWASRRRADWVGLALAVLMSLVWCSASVLHRIGLYHGDERHHFLYDTLQDVEPLIAHAAEAGASGDAVLASNRTAYQFRFYAHGRLPNATACLWHQCQTRPIQLLQRWLPTVQARGWLFLLDDEARALAALIDPVQFDRQAVARARGTQLWRITRRGNGP